MPFDIGIGLLLGVLLNDYTELSYSLSLAIGVFAALLPDIDFMYNFMKTRKVPTTEHRDGLHYPLLLIPAAGAVGWFFSPAIGAILALGVLIHFMHDSIGIGFGVKWLYPFRNNSYLFLFQINTPTNKDMSKKRFYSWTDKERTEMIEKYRYDDWINYVYFKPNLFGSFEYAVLLLGIIFAILNA